MKKIIKGLYSRFTKIQQLLLLSLMSDNELHELLKKTPYLDIRNKIWIKLGNVIGDKAYINNNTILIDSSDFSPNVVLGNRVALAPGVTFITCSSPNDSKLKDLSETQKYCKSGTIYIGDDTWIGTGTTIQPSIKIGKNCIIGSMSNVTKDIPDNSLAYGNPASVIKEFKI